ncbi:MULTISPECIES: hypothetical protein [Legionella]|uniref:Substrate of the Dot/Icm secretion system n=1 Tax=Legionella resiliens TaxID=2905958 RepID=A0ABS8WWL1_9GAMM|nr:MULTISPECIES: hypothetical protein [unclassified Legionella]MCE0721699.1 hypothetical protein [Legionella sp. 9fVS26]MCE3530853.1 hypothetical protein [Legionella sp. 8cVS16]QLZ70416.1 hypothetical protein FOLKNPGA_03230 [Legionella sp. PC1000]
MPRHMLFSDEMDFIVTQYLGEKPEWEKREVNVLIPNLDDPDGMNVTYFYNEEKNSVVIPSPLAVKDGEGLGAEPSYQATIAAISEQLGTDRFNICSSLLGKGSGERHYVALYHPKNENGEMSIFDSKISEPERFFNSSDAPSLLEMAWGYLTAPFKAFGLWAFNIGKQINATFLDQQVTIYRLETQPILDAVSCGYHSTGALLVMIDHIDKGECSTEQISSAIIGTSHHDRSAETLLSSGDEISSISPALTKVSIPDRGLKRDLQPKQEDLNQRHTTPSPRAVSTLESINHSSLTKGNMELK